MNNHVVSFLKKRHLKNNINHEVLKALEEACAFKSSVQESTVEHVESNNIPVYDKINGVVLQKIPDNNNVEEINTEESVHVHKDEVKLEGPLSDMTGKWIVPPGIIIDIPEEYIKKDIVEEEVSQ